MGASGRCCARSGGWLPPAVTLLLVRLELLRGGEATVLSTRILADVRGGARGRNVAFCAGNEKCDHHPQPPQDKVRPANLDAHDSQVGFKLSCCIPVARSGGRQMDQQQQIAPTPMCSSKRLEPAHCQSTQWLVELLGINQLEPSSSRLGCTHTTDRPTRPTAGRILRSATA